jgi:ferredoxin
MSTVENDRRSRRRHSGQKLRVDPVLCDGIGQCAMIASSIIHLDRWGYPVVPTGELSTPNVGRARRAVNACPRQALFFEEIA